MSELPDVRVTRKAVYIGGTKLPDPILDGGVTVQPGGSSKANIVTVQFIVGEVICEDTCDE